VLAGGMGVVFGRNIWQHANPAGMVRALRAVIHEDARAEEAPELLRS
jgi:class I fructose-bisphosphate aldolase